MKDIAETLAGTPIPTILVIAGILFLLMSVAEKISGHLTIPETRKKQALILGLALLAVGVALFVLQSTPNSPDAVETTTPSPPNSPDPDVSKTQSACDRQVAELEDMDWAEMTEEQQKHLSVIGWVAESWTADEYSPSRGTVFKKLLPGKQAAVLGLGICPDGWDKWEGSH